MKTKKAAAILMVCIVFFMQSLSYGFFAVGITEPENSAEGSVVTVQEPTNTPAGTIPPEFTEEPTPTPFVEDSPEATEEPSFTPNGEPSSEPETEVPSVAPEKTETDEPGLEKQPEAETSALLINDGDLQILMDPGDIEESIDGLFESPALLSLIKSNLSIPEEEPLTRTNILELIFLGLDISNVTSLKGLEEALELNALYMSGGTSGENISLEPIKNLPNLEVISCTDFEAKMDMSSFSESGTFQFLRSLELSWCTSLNQSDINHIGGLTSLEELSICYMENINESSFLQGLSSLKSLEMYMLSLSDLSGLQGLTQLNTLDLSANKISDIEPLQGLVHLEHLELCYNQISDVSPLKNLSNLIYLCFNNNKVGNIDEIASLFALPSIEGINFSNNQILDISVIEPLLPDVYYDFNTEKRTLSIEIGELTDGGYFRFPSPIKGINEMNISMDPNKAWVTYDEATEEFILNINQMDLERSFKVIWYGESEHFISFDGILTYKIIGDVPSPSPEPTPTPKPLPTPALDGNIEHAFEDEALKQEIRQVLGLGDDEFITEVNVLEMDTLYCWGEEITSLEGLQYAKNLTVIGATGTFDTLLPISDLDKLILLDLESNYIRDSVLPVGNLTSLKDLSVFSYGKGQINDISQLSNLSDLTDLCLYNNAITDISALASLTKLEYLELNNNRIEDISPVKDLPVLWAASLDRNNIIDVSSLPDNVFFECGSCSSVANQTRTINLGDIVLDQNEHSFTNPVNPGQLPVPKYQFSPSWVSYSNESKNIILDLNALEELFPQGGAATFTQIWGNYLEEEDCGGCGGCIDDCDDGIYEFNRAYYENEDCDDCGAEEEKIPFSGKITYKLNLMLPEPSTPTPEPTPTPTPEPTATPESTPTPTPEPTGAPVIESTSTATVTPTITPTSSAVPTGTPAPSPTAALIITSTATASSKAGVPYTGDDFDILPYLIILTGSAAAIVVAVILLRRKKGKK